MSKTRRVLIVGLLGNQVELVRRAYLRRLELRFLRSTDSMIRSGQLAAHCDVTVAMIGWLDHVHAGVLSKHAQHYVRIPSGMTSLRRTLDALAGAELQSDRPGSGPALGKQVLM